MGRPKRRRLVKLLTNRAEIVLNNGGVAVVDLTDLDKVKDFAWHMDAHGYARRRVPPGGVTLMHRVILNADKTQKIDHINRISRDNRKINLRIASHSENMMNRPCLLSGVSFRKENGKWRARITVDGEKMSLGTFSSRAEAILARREAEKRYFGEFAFRGAVP